MDADLPVECPGSVKQLEKKRVRGTTVRAHGGHVENRMELQRRLFVILFVCCMFIWLLSS